MYTRKEWRKRAIESDEGIGFAIYCCPECALPQGCEQINGPGGCPSLLIPFNKMLAYHGLQPNDIPFSMTRTGVASEDVGLHG